MKKSHQTVMPLCRNEQPILTPEVLEALKEMQEGDALEFDNDIDELMDFIILFNAEERPELAMKHLSNLRLLKHSIRNLIPCEE